MYMVCSQQSNGGAPAVPAVATGAQLSWFLGFIWIGPLTLAEADTRAARRSRR